MPKILANTPPGYDWGWYSREDPRMHLQVLDPQGAEDQHKVWLEEKGRRIVEPTAKIPNKVLKVLKARIVQNRRFIEDRWVRFMIRQGWLQVYLSAPKATLVAYPNTPNSFIREIDLSQDILPEEARKLRQRDIRLSPEMASLQIWPALPEDQRQDIRLSTILWQD
jgi:hypothetical protein